MLEGPGESLDQAARGFFEPRLGQDLSEVRVQQAWNALGAANRTKFLGEIGASNVGARIPDIAEFHLADGQIRLIDPTGDPLSPLHRFKSDFYREAMKRMVGPDWPAVFTQDINPARPLTGSAPR